MWVVTVFAKDDVRIFEYQEKKDAMELLKKHKHAVLSYTN